MRPTNLQHYDVILAGGGAAGLSLAYRLNESFPERSLLIVDEKVKQENDHTWCFWSRTPSYLDAIAYRTWDRLAILSDEEANVLDLAPYRYRMVRAVDFYRHMREKLAHRDNVDFMVGTVEAVVDGATRAEVHVNAQHIAGDWVFDSRYRASDLRPQTRRHRFLLQHFLGWEIETERAVFDPHVPRMFDFRTPQQGAMRFCYVLPYTERRGLVEYTLFSNHRLPIAEYQSALHTYIDEILGAQRYRILEEEQDVIPMTDHVIPRRAGNRVLNIGTRGGRVKPSSGYAFQRIQRDARAIVQSIAAHDHPFDLPEPPRRYRTFDAMLLQILQRHGHLGRRIFLQLFRRNPIRRIFRFLDEEDGVLENLKVMTSVPPWPFIRAWVEVKRQQMIGGN
jgi:lycopene beta-cyclase